jgi:hypothetical protein
MEWIPNPIIKTHIHAAVFEHGEIVIYPNAEKTVPEELTRVARYLFGESAQLIPDYIHGHKCLRITNATFIVANSTSVNANWTVEREEPAIIPSITHME